MTQARTRERFTLVALTTAAAVLLTSSLAGAAGGDSVYACVEQASGSIRIVDAGDPCRKNEIALDWSKTGNAYTAGSGLELSADNEFSVTGAPWSGITGVPADLADGDDDGTARVEQLRSELAPEITALGTGLDALGTDLGDLRAGLATDDGAPNESDDPVSFSRINDLVGSIFGLYIADETVTADDLANNSVGSSELASNAVTSVHIGDGTISSADLAFGSVTTDHQAANAGTTNSNLPVPLSDGTGATAAETILDIPLTGSLANHSVLIVGQVALDCTGCDFNASVAYQVLRNDGSGTIPVSPTFAIGLDSSESDVVLPVSLLDFTGEGTHTYSLTVTVTGIGSGTATVDSATLSAVDLGRLG